MPTLIVLIRVCTASINASFYDIREFFHGRNDKGTMNTRSTDEKYNALIGTLRERVRILTEKIRPKVCEYGFLRDGATGRRNFSFRIVLL